MNWSNYYKWVFEGIVLVSMLFALLFAFRINRKDSEEIWNMWKAFIFIAAFFLLIPLPIIGIKLIFQYWYITLITAVLVSYFYHNKFSISFSISKRSIK